jgi:hypothetical protein
VLGHLIMTYDEGTLQSGSTSLKLPEPSDIANGVYFLRVDVSGIVKTQKVVIQH